MDQIGTLTWRPMELTMVIIEIALAVIIDPSRSTS